MSNFLSFIIVDFNSLTEDMQYNPDSEFISMNTPIFSMGQENF